MPLIHPRPWLEIMILIISRSTLETTTEQVVDYLIARGIPFVRLNGDDLDGSQPFALTLDISATGCVLELDGIRLRAEEITAVWYRRWRSQALFGSPCVCDDAAKISWRLASSIGRHLDLESQRLSTFFFSLFSHANWLSGPTAASLNKLTVLRRAVDVGLDIPSTLVATDRDTVLRFIARHGRVITKPVSEAPSFSVGGSSYPLYTQQLDKAEVEQLPPKFFPSLFQECLQKEYEIRVFYLEERCFSAAIFSQSDERTQTDFRRYNFTRSNRIVPYRLPVDVEYKVRQLMIALGLETGSLDIVKTLQGRYVFLEVNPLGQFGMISDSCNYHLERIVADSLCRRADYGKS